MKTIHSVLLIILFISNISCLLYTSTRRGVDVEEADGVQDIGETFITIFGDEVIGEGTDLDYWYAGNESELFKNIFSKDTRPDTKTNSGANSLITIKDFSSIANKMSFNIEYGDSVIKPLFVSNVNVSSEGLSITYLESDKNLFAINSDSMLIISNGDSVIQSIDNFSDFKPAAVKYGNNTYLIGATINNPAQQFPSNINFWFTDGISITSGSFVVFDKVITSAPVIRKINTEVIEVLFGTSDGEIIIYNLDSLIAPAPTRKSSIMIEPGVEVKQIALINSKVFAIASKLGNNKYDLIYNDGSIIKFNDERLLKLVSNVNVEGNVLSIASSEKIGGYSFYVTSVDKIVANINAPSYEAAISFSLADLKNDGNNYLVTNSCLLYTSRCV